MQVILKEDIQGTGKKGDLVKVSDGYAKNYLLKKGLAVQATSQALNEMKAKQESIDHKVQQELEQAQLAARQIQDKTVKITAKAGAKGKLFGSITPKEIAEILKKQFGINVDKRKVSLEEDIKSFGTFTAEVKLHTKVTAKVYVSVSEEV